MIERLARDSLVGMTGGFIIWSIYFVAIYAFLSVGCVIGLDRTRVLGVDAVLFTLALLTVLTLLLIAYFGWRSFQLWQRERDRDLSDPEHARRHFMTLMTLLISGAALLTTLWVGAPIVFLAPCS